MHICFTVYDTPDQLGGPMVNARRLLPELRRRGHRISALILYWGASSPMASVFRDSGIECRVVRKQEYTEDAVRWILRQVGGLSPDVFVANLSVPAFFASRWIRRAGIPTIAALRSDDPFHWTMIDQFVAGPETWAVSGLVSVSAGLLDVVKERNPRHTRFAVIPSGVPVPSTGCRHDGPIRMVYVGLLNQYRKRIMDVAVSMGRVLERDPGATASFYGEGQQRAELERFVREHACGSRIRVEGLVPCEEIQERLLLHNVIVLLSDAEGTPGAVMDGMACGLVPVCLDIRGGVRELVLDGKTGLLVKDRGDSFVRAIDRLREDVELRQRLGLGAREHICRDFSLEVAAARWETFCRELLGSRENGRKGSLRVPRGLSLPPSCPGFDREDVRRPALWREAYWDACVLGRRLLRRRHAKVKE